MRVMARVAAEAVVGRRERHGEGVAALGHLCSSSDDLNAGIAAALLGDHAVAKRRLRGAVHPAYADQAANYLAVLYDAITLRMLATTSVAATRNLLKLPPTPDGPSWW